MEDNPYSSLAGMMKSDGNQMVLYQGVVVKKSPLTISVAGITVSGDELRVNAAMLEQSVAVKEANISGSLSASVNCGVGTISQMTITGGTLTTTALIIPNLAVGDTVLLLTTDAQQFFVLCKVVGV